MQVELKISLNFSRYYKCQFIQPGETRNC